MSEEREEERQERDIRTVLLLLTQLVVLAQERNTLALGSLSELRDIHKGVDKLVAAIPQPPGQLKSIAMIFGASQI